MSTPTGAESDPVAVFYDTHDERERLRRGEGCVEFVRTQELLRAELPATPARVLDVGGADGVHATWLANDGFDVQIVDPIEIHVERARSNGFVAERGDARSLSQADDSFEVVLLLGPLYHLRERADRITALTEARRVVCSGGLVAAAGVSRLAVSLDWLRRGLLADPVSRTAARRIRDVGVDDTGAAPGAFYFHTVADLEDELRAAGFANVIVRGVEGPAWPLLDPTCPPDHPSIAHVVDIAHAADTNPATAGASAHLLALAARDHSGVDDESNCKPPGC